MLSTKDTIQQTIEHLSGINHAEFLTEYVMKRKPAIITDATKTWRALDRWTPQYFKSRYGEYPVNINGTEYKLGNLMDLAMDSKGETAVPYLRNQTPENLSPELAADIDTQRYYFQPNWLNDRMLTLGKPLRTVEMFIGGAGSTFPFLHYDYAHTHAFLNQIYGPKEVILFSPDQTPFLYPGKSNGVSQVDDIENPDLSRFPLFAQAKQIRLMVNPGQTLFIPAGWWHTTRMHSASITVTVSTLNATNWNDFARDITRNKRHGLREVLLCWLFGAGQIKRLLSHA